jgi:hypothetical protein
LGPDAWVRGGAGYGRNVVDWSRNGVAVVFIDRLSKKELMKESKTTARKAERGEG